MNEKKQNAEVAQEYLRQAERNLKYAGDAAQKSGDGAMTKRIEKVHTETATIKKDLDQKLGGAEKA